MNDDKTRIVTPRYSRRNILKTGAAAGAAGLAAGISPKASKVFAAPTVLQGDPVTLDYFTWFYNEPGRGDAWKAMIADFEASQSDIKVNMTGWPFDDFSNNIIVQLQAGKLDGDLIQTTPDLVLRLLKAGVLTDLNPVLQANAIDTLSQAHDYITVDGAVMGLDVVTVVFGLFYNTGLFDAAGITADKLPVDPASWMAVSKELTDRPNQFGLFNDHLVSEPSSFWFTLQQWACIYDGTWADGSTPLLDSQPVHDALTLFKQAYDDSFPQGVDNATANQLWANQQIASQLIVSAAANVYKDSAPDFYPNMNTYALPWESKKAVSRIHPITINNQSEKGEAAMAFLTWLYAPENYRNLLTRSLDVIPAYEVGGLDDYFAGIHWLTGFKDINMITPPQMVGDFIFNNDEYGQIVISNFQNVLAGNQSVEDAMATAQSQAVELAGRLSA